MGGDSVREKAEIYLNNIVEEEEFSFDEVQKQFIVDLFSRFYEQELYDENPIQKRDQSFQPISYLEKVELLKDTFEMSLMQYAIDGNTAFIYLANQSAMEGLNYSRLGELYESVSYFENVLDFMDDYKDILEEMVDNYEEDILLEEENKASLNPENAEESLINLVSELKNNTSLTAEKKEELSQDFDLYCQILGYKREEVYEKNPILRKLE